jgi:Domain of unknown function (DUF6984)
MISRISLRSSGLLATGHIFSPVAESTLALTFLGDSPMRNLTDDELQILERMLTQLAHGRDEVYEQLRSAKVTPIDKNGSLRFHVTSPVVAAGINQRVPVTAIFDDADGMPIYILLHVVEGKLWELEIYKADGSRILNPSIPERLYF